MLKLMIVDDEKIVLDGLKFLIEDTMDDVEVVATVRSGREAILLCDDIHPDIVFMDINMPGINGIEAIENIKKRHRNIRFVIISAYEQFDYAKQAMDLGVEQYLLKPVNPDKVKEVLTNIISEIEIMKKQRMQEIENREKLEKVIPILEHGFIYSLLMGRDYQEEMIKYQELFEVKKERAYIMLIEFGEGNHDSLENKIGSGVKGQSFYPKVQSLIKSKCQAVIGPLIVNRITVLVYEGITDEYEQRLQAVELANKMLQEIETLVETNIFIGIGSCYPIEKCKHSLEEALYAINWLQNEKIGHFNDISGVINEDGYTYIDIKEDENQIIRLFELGKKEKVLDEIKLFFCRLNKKYHGEINNIRNSILELMVMILSYSYRNEMQDEELGYTSYLKEINSINDLIELESWCLRKIAYIFDKISENKEKHISKIVLEATAFIDLHLTEDISLVDISKEVAVSPQYFSKVFKDEMGLSYIEYVREKRIDIAKDLLKSSNYSVKEICYLIGYNDPNYFSRLFKKLVGVSPTEYK